MASAVMTMDPPHVVNTGVACMACCNVAPGKLNRCGACDSAWYCNQDCQRKDFKAHKPFCKALRLFHALQADLPPEAWPRTAADFYVQRTNCQRLLEPMLRRPLSRAELRAILGEAHCSVCMRTRAQLARSGQPAAAAVVAAAPTADLGTAAAASSCTAATVGPGQPAGTAADGAASKCTAVTAMSEGPGAAAAALGLPEGSPAAGAAAAGAVAGAATPSASTGAANMNGPAAPVAAAATPAAPAAAPSLSCCLHCHWGWACSDHRDAYLAGPHAAVCMSYQHMNDSQLLTHRYLTATGRLPNYVPDKLRPVGQGRPMGQARPGGHQMGSSSWEAVPAGWPAYQAWRPLPSFDQAMMCLLTKRMSQALTVVQALQHHYTPQQLAARSHLEVHVMGASAFEVPADRIWEEILNLMPPHDPRVAATAAATDAAANGAADGAGRAAEAATTAAAAAGAAGSSGADSAVVPPRVLHVAFVGPELAEIIIEESDGRALAQGSSLSSPPPQPGRELLYSYHCCTYQEWAAGRGRAGAGGSTGASGGGNGTPCLWRRPDLAVAFNSGVSESDKALWAPALGLLVRHNVPVMFTSYNRTEAEADAAVWRRAGGEVTLGPERNPFRALEPTMEPSQVDCFYYQNYYWWCGRAGPPAPTT